MGIQAPEELRPIHCRGGSHRGNRGCQGVLAPPADAEGARRPNWQATDRTVRGQCCLHRARRRAATGAQPSTTINNDSVSCRITSFRRTSDSSTAQPRANSRMASPSRWSASCSWTIVGVCWVIEARSFLITTTEPKPCSWQRRQPEVLMVLEPTEDGTSHRLATS